MYDTRIEWCDYTINPVKGLCPIACPYCYARRMYHRFGWSPEIKLDYEVIATMTGNLLKLKGKRIFWGSTFELFHGFAWPILPTIFQAVKALPQHTHVFLTKQSQNLTKWSPFPPNCWVGVSATDDPMLTHAWAGLTQIEAAVKFASLEPLLNWNMAISDMVFTFKSLDWLIIGQQTPLSKRTQPKIEWLLNIIKAADKAKIPIFLKDNLRPAIADAKLSATDALPFYEDQTCDLRQEYPSQVKGGRVKER